MNNLTKLFLDEIHNDYNLFVKNRDYYSIIEDLIKDTPYSMPYTPKSFPHLDVICGYILYPVYSFGFTSGKLVFKQCEYCGCKSVVNYYDIYCCKSCYAPLYKMGKEFRYVAN